jgi:hypothetical protein
VNLENKITSDGRKNTPAKNPSTVFFGETLSNNFCFQSSLANKVRKTVIDPNEGKYTNDIFWAISPKINSDEY